MTFGVISFRFVEAGWCRWCMRGMGVEALAAPATGDLFDRYGGRVLLVVAAAPPLCADSVADVAWFGVLDDIPGQGVLAPVANLPGFRKPT
jgi:hypothetical protein